MRPGGVRAGDGIRLGHVDPARRRPAARPDRAGCARGSPLGAVPLVKAVNELGHRLEPLLPYGYSDRAPDQIGVGELLARPAVPIVDEDGLAGPLELVRQALGDA